MALLVARDDVLDEIETQPGFEDAGFTADDLFAASVVFLAIFAIWCLIATVLGVFVLRRSNAARILLVISCAMTILVSLIGISSGISAGDPDRGDRGDRAAVHRRRGSLVQAAGGAAARDPRDAAVLTS